MNDIWTPMTAIKYFNCWTNKLYFSVITGRNTKSPRSGQYTTAPLRSSLSKNGSNHDMEIRPAKSTKELTFEVRTRAHYEIAWEFGSVCRNIFVYSYIFLRPRVAFILSLIWLIRSRSNFRSFWKVCVCVHGVSWRR